MDVSDRLITRSGQRDRPCLEGLVAYQWERPLDTLGGRHARHRDNVVLRWLADGVPSTGGSVLDIGCAYGNYLFMLNAKLGAHAGVAMHGIDLDDEGLHFAEAFAQSVPGFDNCHFARADVSAPLAFDTHSFDAVNLADVLEHMESPTALLSEIRRVLRPGGTLIVSTPLKTTLFKRVAATVNRISAGRLYGAYYRGKRTEVDESGEPVMHTRAGHDHISEMEYDDLIRLAVSSGFVVDEVELMSVMSGSEWFDRHPAMLSVLLLLEAIHLKLRRPSWAHSVCLRLKAA